MEDDVSIDELREEVEHMHGVPASYVEAGEVVWQGAVKVFALTGHPSTSARSSALQHLRMARPTSRRSERGAAYPAKSRTLAECSPIAPTSSNRFGALSRHRPALTSRCSSDRTRVARQARTPT